MIIRHVKIQNFRGIRELDWRVDGSFICLIGPGDSTKSTILDAIELTLSPRWNETFDDSDFYRTDITNPIEISITLGALPDELLRDDKFGLETCGWNSELGLRDEPEDADELVLTIRLSVDSSLEPTWTVINDRNKPDGKPISASSRASLGVGRLGSFVDHHLSWSRGSVLYRLTGKADEMAVTLAEAGRAARLAIDPEDLPTLNKLATRAQELGEKVGVAPKDEYRPMLDIKSISIGAGGVALHDGNVPVRKAGLGSRRLLSLALKREAAKQGGITLIDEVEHGLEPHRIRRLLYFLNKEEGSRGQVLMSTHSPVVLTELSATDLRIVRSHGGNTEVLSVTADLQPIVRKAPDALLGKSVIVCEGRTELGVMRTLDRKWEDAGSKSFGYLGVVPIDGGGTQAPKVAVSFAGLGYKVAFLGDSDAPLTPNQVELKKLGIEVFQWEDDFAIEQQIMKDLPWLTVQRIVSIAESEYSKDSVWSSVAQHMELKPKDLPESVLDWVDSTKLRSAISKAAKGSNSKNGWFKNIEMGEKLGYLINNSLKDITESVLAKKLDALRNWTSQI